MTDVRSVDDPQGAALLVLFLPRSCHGNVQVTVAVLFLFLWSSVADTDGFSCSIP